MGEVALQRPHFAHSALVWSATLAALTLLVAVCAYWTWAWLAPLPAPRAQTSAAQPRLAAAYALFGGAPTVQTAVAQTGPAIRLLGVAAASRGKSGYAVVQLDASKSLVVREGADIAPGVRLAQVRADDIIVERGGVRETLVLPEKSGRAREQGPQQASTVVESAQRQGLINR